MHLTPKIFLGAILLAALLPIFPAIGAVESASMVPPSGHHPHQVITEESTIVAGHSCECEESCAECRGCPECLSLFTLPQLRVPQRYCSANGSLIIGSIPVLASLTLPLDPPPPKG